MAEVVSSEKVISPANILKKLIYRFPEGRKIISLDMIRGRIINLARKEFHRVKEEGYRVNIDVYRMLKVTFIELQRFLMKKTNEKFKIMLIQSSIQSHLDNNRIRKLATAFEVAHDRFVNIRSKQKINKEEKDLSTKNEDMGCLE